MKYPITCTKQQREQASPGGLLIVWRQRKNSQTVTPPAPMDGKPPVQ